MSSLIGDLVNPPISWSVGNSTGTQQLVHLISWIRTLKPPFAIPAHLISWCTAGTNWQCKRMAGVGVKQKKPPSAIALAVSVAHASQLHVLTLLQAETSKDSEKVLGNVGERWAATVDHMEEILQADPDHGHTLMVIFTSLLDSFYFKFCDLFSSVKKPGFYLTISILTS